jgi:hypothetical protein
MHLSTMISVLTSVVFGVSAEHIRTTKPYCAESTKISTALNRRNRRKIYYVDHRNYLLRRIREGGGRISLLSSSMAGGAAAACVKKEILAHYLTKRKMDRLQRGSTSSVGKLFGGSMN